MLKHKEIDLIERRELLMKCDLTSSELLLLIKSGLFTCYFFDNLELFDFEEVKMALRLAFYKYRHNDKIFRIIENSLEVLECEEASRGW